MRQLRAYRAEVIVLQGKDFGEADRLLTLFSLESGKLRAIAKGVRRTTSRMSGHIDLLTHSQVLLAHGQNLDLVTQSQAIETFGGLREDLLRIGQGLYCAELIDRFMEEGVENRPLFAQLVQVLRDLSAVPEQDIGLVVRAYELSLLGLVGYRPQLFRCVGCEQLIEPGRNTFVAADGGVRCPSCSGREELDTLPGTDGDIFGQRVGISVPALKLLRHLQTDPAAIIGRVQVPGVVADEAEAVLRRYIHFLLERNPRTNGLIDAIKRLDALPPPAPSAIPATPQ